MREKNEKARGIEIVRGEEEGCFSFISKCRR